MGCDIDRTYASLRDGRVEVMGVEGCEAASSRCTAVEKRFQNAGSRTAAIGETDGVWSCGNLAVVTEMAIRFVARLRLGVFRTPQDLCVLESPFEIHRTISMLFVSRERKGRSNRLGFSGNDCVGPKSVTKDCSV